jgi:TRAP-type uncharacterized transport system substrate-binding protein
MVLRSIRAFSLLCTIAVGATSSIAQDAPLTLKAAGNGSTFTPYAEGLAKFLLSKDIRIEVKRSSGSNENLSMNRPRPWGPCSWDRPMTR